MRRILGVLNGRDLPAAAVQAWADSAELVYAADGAADLLACPGLTIVGDLDSVKTPPASARIVSMPDQNSSDADKLLALASAEGAESMTLAGVEGDRLDHVLGTLGSCLRSSLTVRLVLRRGIGWLLRGGEEIVLPAAPHQRFSLMALPEARGVSASGCAWPLAGASLMLSGLQSLSNRAEGPVKVCLESGALLAVLLEPQPPEPRW